MSFARFCHQNATSAIACSSILLSGHIRDLMPAAMSDIVGDAHPDSLLLERRLWVTVGFFLAAPLAFSRTLGALKCVPGFVPLCDVMSRSALSESFSARFRTCCSGHGIRKDHRSERFPLDNSSLQPFSGFISQTIRNDGRWRDSPAS